MNPTTLTIENVCMALRRNGFNCECFENREGALRYFDSLVKDVATVGIGGSLTIDELGIPDRLKRAGIKIISRAEAPVRWNEAGFRDYIQNFFFADLYMCSANAITAEGKIIYIDGTGDRVAPLLFGPPKCVIIAGRNKLVDNEAAGIARIKDYVAPTNARLRGYNTACAKIGHCVNCRGSSRSCNATVIFEQPTRLSDITVLLINEDIGL